MEGVQIKTPEARRNIRIEHFPGIDVVVNLDYSDTVRQEEILRKIKRYAEEGYKGYKIFSQINNTHGEDGFEFFCKDKDDNGFVPTKEKIDYMVGRTGDDFLNENAVNDFDQESRYAMISILNEIILSPEIKKLIKTKDFQDIAVEHGFKKLIFPEPILAFVDKVRSNRFLVYEKLKGNDPRHLENIRAGQYREFNKISQKLRELFLKHGIIAHDLRWVQFIVTKDNDLVLIDIEGYTKQRENRP